MKGKWRWYVAIIICILIIYSDRQPSGELHQIVQNTVYSTKDFELTRELFSGEQDGKVAVFQPTKELILQYQNVTETADGFMFTFNQETTIFARTAGIVIYTGHLKNNGKIMIVSYNNGITATYQLLDTLHQFPYTAVKQGQELASISSGKLLLSAHRNGEPLSEKELIEWLTYAQ